MGLVRNYRRCAWLVTYLFGASPALCRSFRPEGHELLTELDRGTWYAPYATSLRMSDLATATRRKAACGFRELAGGVHRRDPSAVTTEEPRYAAIGVVVDGEYRQLNANILQIENEYYSTIRPKPSKASKSATDRGAAHEAASSTSRCARWISTPATPSASTKASCVSSRRC